MRFEIPRAAMVAALLLILVGTAAAQAQESEWPKVLKGEKGEIQIYQPQLESFSGNKVEARSAVSVKSAGQKELIFGAMWFDCDLATDLESRTATLERVTVTAAKFPEVEQAKVAKLSRYLEKEIPKWDLVISLDRLAASLEGVAQTAGARENLRNDPPAIHFRSHPAVLVLVDGDPILADLEGFDLEYVANSVFFIVKDKKARAYFLRGAGFWFTSDDLVGKWSVTTDLPAAVAEVSRKIEAEEKDQVEAQKADAENLDVAKDADEQPPEIILSTVPAELIVSAGEPALASVEGTQLLYLSNSENDVLLDIASQEYFVLISGRWYRSRSLSDGPWQFVDFDDLPAEFAAIPADSDMGKVLVGVAGTQEAREAVLETQIPQTAEVDRKSATCEVSYDGDPQFKSCGEGVSYAVNTDKSVLLIDRKYYCVDSAIWFVGDGPEGPWLVATEVPAEVQDLPADCPVYNVKYVYIYDVSPEVIYVGYTPGYYGHYVYGPCVVYGTGWYYRPWYGSVYYPRPVTYGFGVHYSPWTGWGFTFGMSYGWLHVGTSWGHSYHGCWGAGGYRYGYRQGYWHGYNHGYNRGFQHGAAAGYRAGYKAGQRQPRANVYRARANGVKRTGDLGKQARNRPATTDRRNNVYTDRKGDVYRDRDGQWEKREGKNWESERERSGEGTRPTDGRERDEQRSRDAERVKPDDRAQRDRNRDQVKPQERQQRDRQQLERDRGSRQRGNDRQRQAPQRRTPQRSGGSRRR